MSVMIRLLLLVAAGWVAFLLVRRLLKAPNPNASSSAPSPTETAPLMKPCAHCGVHVPTGESVQSRGHFFCSEAHRDAFLEHQGPPDA